MNSTPQWRTEGGSGGQFEPDDTGFEVPFRSTKFFFLEPRCFPTKARKFPSSPMSGIVHSVAVISFTRMTT